MTPSSGGRERSSRWRRRRRRWRAQLLVISIQLARKNIFLVEAALEKAVRKGWFSREEKLQAEDKIRQTGGGGASRIEMKERRMLTLLW